MVILTVYICCYCALPKSDFHFFVGVGSAVGPCVNEFNFTRENREIYIQLSTIFLENFPEEIPTGFTKLILMLGTNRKNLKESEPPYR